MLSKKKKTVQKAEQEKLQMWQTAYYFANVDKDAADKLSKTVDEACLLLAEYNGRLAAELEDRRQLARMLTEYITSQREALMEREKKLEVRHHMPHQLSRAWLIINLKSSVGPL